MFLCRSVTRLAFATALSGLLALPAAAAPKVIASIVPLHSLVASVMDGVGEPELLLRGQNSEHQASYSPAQIEQLGKADIVFIMGEGLELKLTELSGSEAVNGRTFVQMSGAPGLVKLPIREGGTFEKDEDAGENFAGGTASFDPHLWLDPENAKAMAALIADTLEKADPDNASRYAANEAALVKDLDGLTAEIAGDVAPVKDKSFVVFHDAYQYFEKRFGLKASGSISDFAATEPSAERLKEVRDKVKSANAACAFREPQFSDKAVMVVIEGTGAKEGVLDPVGATLEPGKQAYSALLRNIAQNLKTCLSP